MSDITDWTHLQKEIEVASFELERVKLTAREIGLKEPSTTNRIEALFDALEVLKERLSAKSDGGPIQPTSRIAWNGTKRELADWILAAWRDGKIKAPSELNALNQAAEHFRMDDGTAVSGKSLQSNLHNRKIEQTP